MDIFPPEIVWKWVNEDVDQRAWYLATFVPKVLHREKEKVCWARELLVRYGYLESVRNNLHANFGSGSWSGSASQYFARQQKKAIDFRKDESEPQVIRWLDEYIDRLEHDVQREKMREERDDF